MAELSMITADWHYQQPMWRCWLHRLI